MSTAVPTPRVHRARRRAIGLLVAAGTVATTVAATGSGGPTVEAGLPGPETIQILSFNDYHGHVENDASSDFGDPKSGGGEYLSTRLTELRADAATDGIGAASSFTVAAGDLIGGSPFFSGLFHDEPSVESLNVMGLDFSGVGNHEFDEGVDELLRMQQGGCHPVDGCYFPGDPFPGADFQWLAANVIEDAPDGTDDFADIILPYDVTFTADGHPIAFIGMTLEDTDELVAAAGIAGFTFQDEIDAGDATVDAIRLAHPNVEAIVLMLHEGGIPNPFAINGCAGISGPIVAIAEGMNAEIDAIVTGHTHQPYTCTINDPDTNPRPVVSAWSFGRVVTEMRMDLDGAGEVDRSSVTMENHLVLSQAEDDDGETIPEVPDDPATLMPDPDITAIIDKYSPLADVIGEEEVGRITADINRGENGANRGIESDAGNLVADAQLFAVRASDIEADIALMNPGGLRSDLVFAASGAEAEDGIVTFAEALTFQPFNNTMFVLPMTGAQIKQVLLEQCQPLGSSRPFLHLGVSHGFSYDLDTEIVGGDCVEVSIRDVELDGVDLVDTETYDVAVNNFLADGGDNFDTFAEVAPTDRTPGPQDIDALTSYLLANSPVSPPGVNRVHEGPFPPAATSLEPGRILDTRDGGETVDGLFEAEGPLAPNVPLELQVAGRGGVDADAESVVLNVGVIRPEDLGFLTVYPCDEDQPNASNLNFAGGTTVSNAVTTKLSADGTACLVSSVATEVYADVTSFVPVGGSPTAISPARILDNRDGGTTIDGEDQAGGTLAAGEIYELTVVGRTDADGDQLIADDANAVVLNVGAIRPQGDGNGYLTVFPCNDTDTPPNASNVNYITGVNVANSVTVGIGDNGAVCIFSFSETYLIADVTGFVPGNGSPDPLEPARLIDTRDEFPVMTIDGLREGEGMIDANEVVTLQVAGRGGVNADATSANLNVTAVRPVTGGFMTVYPCTDDVPNASQVNFAGTNNVANSVTAPLTDDGTVCIVSSVQTHLLVDVTGSTGPEPVLTFTQVVPV